MVLLFFFSVNVYFMVFNSTFRYILVSSLDKNYYRSLSFIKNKNVLRKKMQVQIIIVAMLDIHDWF